MTITREIQSPIYGVMQKMEFKLTSDELRDAFYEQQAIYDRMDMEYYLEENEDFLLDKGYSKDCIHKLKEYLDDMGSELRRCMDKYDMSWEYARDEAFRRTVERYEFNREP